ncbi:MAG: hypothetical protein ACP5EN_10255, partial [Rhodovulum sp.]
MAALGAMAGAAVLIGLLVFNTLSASLNTLLGEQLPGLRNSVTVIEHTGGIRDALSEMLLAGTTAGVEAGLARFHEEKAHLEEGMNGLPEASAAAMRPLLAELENEARDMRAALSDRFERDAQLDQTIAGFRDLSQQARDLLAQMSDDAAYDMELAGEQTVQAVTDTLTALMDYDFAATALVLRARSEINLLSGISIALAETVDDGLAERLRGIADASLGEFDAILADLEERDAIPDQLPTLVETRAIFAEASRQGFRARAGFMDRLMDLREESETALTYAIDELTYNLMIGAEDTATFNSEAVIRLIDNEMKFIRDAARMELAVETVVATAFLGATVRDLDAAAAAQAELDAAAGALRSLAEEIYITDDLGTIIDGILAFADPETGIVATRAEMLAAQTLAERTSIAAYDQLRQIGEAAVAHGDAALAAAAAAGDAVLSDADRAKEQLRMVALGSLA